MGTFELFSLGCKPLSLEKHGVDSYARNVIVFEESYLSAPLNGLSKHMSRGQTEKTGAYLHFSSFDFPASRLRSGSRRTCSSRRSIVYDHGLIKVGKKGVKINLIFKLEKQTLPCHQPA